MKNNSTFRLKPKAVNDLVSIYQYSYQEFGHLRAEQYIKDLDTSFHQLAQDPNLGRNCKHIRSELLAFNVVSHVVFFQLSTYGIQILRVLHNSMDYAHHLK